MFPHLVELCLDSVAENFARQHLLFTTSDNYYTKRKLAFLQKKYSLDLISRLSVKEDGLSEEFLDIVVNRYTKFLDTRWFKKVSADKLSSKLAEIGCNLEKTVCDRECLKVGFPEAIKDSVCHFIHLKSFTFHFECDDWILKNVAKFCPHIEEIDVHSSRVTSEGVRYLCRDENGKVLCTTLKKLIFGPSSLIKDKDVEYLLQNLPSLEVIVHPDLPRALYFLHKENLSSLNKVAPYSITTLDFMPYFPFMDDIVKVCASVCPRLKNVSFAFENQKDFFCLFVLPDVEQLHISDYSLCRFNLDSFLTSKGSRLTSLCIRHCTVSVSVLAEKCPCLKELILLEADLLGNEDSKPVFNSLSSLTFIYNTQNAEGMELILSSSSLIQLESLSFKNCELESPEVAILKCCELCPIRNMTFDNCGIKKEFIEDLLRICRTLDYLTLNDLDNGERRDLLDFIKLLPNKPKISIGGWIQPVWLPYGESFW